MLTWLIKRVSNGFLLFYLHTSTNGYLAVTTRVSHSSQSYQILIRCFIYLSFVLLESPKLTFKMSRLQILASQLDQRSNSQASLEPFSLRRNSNYFD